MKNIAQMQMNAIDTFLAIAATGSFHGAAQELNITQTTVSARIKVLEAELSMSLFERGPGGTRLSAAGQQFRPYAEQMQQTWRFVRSGAVNALEERISLRLGAQLSIWDGLLVDLAIWLEEQKGKLPFTLNYDHALNMAEAVAQQLLDLVIVSEVPQATRLRVEDLPPEELVLVSDQALSLGDIQDRARQLLFINLDFGRQYDLSLQRVIPKGSRQHIVLGNASMGLRYLHRRGGMGYFPYSMVAQLLQAGSLQIITDAPPIFLDCKALYHPETVAMAQIEDALEGLHGLRGSAAA
ncbi:LysR family transcriptional regulator [Pseudophaeobacter sp.]|uniref:LysR family transcriptional regulator n=1 Tax=Pseudophaeobacter sp. TaxID=1971739 RepID=UPI004059B3EC